MLCAVASIKRPDGRSRNRADLPANGHADKATAIVHRIPADAVINAFFGFRAIGPEKDRDLGERFNQRLFFLCFRDVPNGETEFMFKHVEPRVKKSFSPMPAHVSIDGLNGFRDLREQQYSVIRFVPTSHL